MEIGPDANNVGLGTQHKMGCEPMSECRCLVNWLANSERLSTLNAIYEFFLRDDLMQEGYVLSKVRRHGPLC